MLPDILSVALRALSFVCLFQATGAAIFIAAFGRGLTQSLNDVRRSGWIVAIAGLAFALAHYSLEAARMAGDLSGVADASLQKMVLSSTSSTMVVLRMLGLLLVAIGLRHAGDLRLLAAVIGAALAVASFVMVGHSATHSARWLLVAMLMMHLLIVAFWFGALWPLYVVTKEESPGTASKVIDSFSLVAVWLVPGILFAGLAMAVVLIPDLEVFGEPYGELLIVKFVGFALLMLLAAANKWRFGPAIARGEVHAIRMFRRSVVSEYALIAMVLATTAVMTSFFSPEH